MQNIIPINMTGKLTARKKANSTNELTESIKQLLVLTWLNANASRRQDVLSELETIAKAKDINLIKEVVETITQISQAEMVSEAYYAKYKVKD